MSDNSINFDHLIEKMQKAQVTDADRPTILGGQFAIDRLEDFLKIWQNRWSQMPFRLWEHVSHIEFADAPGEPEFLQRAEIFGKGGHLSLRRDAGRWLWHYVGEKIDASMNDFGAKDFWAAHPGCTLRRYEESVILWGERKKDHNLWFDDRAAAARLVYPVNANGRVYLHFWRYTENGQTAFVWYRELSNQPLQEH
jgi:hypothetical protein